MDRILRILLLAAALLAAASGRAADTGGVRFDDKARVGGAELVLNGAGLRSRLVFKVYAIGLYTTERKPGAEALLALKGAKRLHIVTLRDLTAEQFADALVAGIHKNHGEAEYAALKARVETFRAVILALKTAPSGAVVLIDWLPEGGTRLTFNGERRGDDIPGEDFYQALLRIWLGEHPAQDDLKEALLGKAG